MSEPEKTTDAQEAGGAYSGYSGTEAPWSPIPLQEIKTWLKLNPDAKMESVFPTVYEEDRTAKIKDLATAQGLMYITHRRAAEQTVKELGFENYDYPAEQAQIRTESKLLSPTGLGMADGIARSVVGLPSPGSPNGAPRGGGVGDPTVNAVPVGGAGSEPEPQVKRQDVSGTAQHEFRKSQKEAELEAAFLEEVARLLRSTRETQAQNNEQVVSLMTRFQESLAQVVERLGTPVVHVHVPEPKPRVIKLTRDARGLMTAMEETMVPEKPKLREKSK